MLLERAKGQRALDIGAGTGRIGQLLERRFKEVVLVEPSTPMISLLKKRSASEGSQVLKSEILNLPFRDSTFDVVTSIRVLWHLEKPSEALIELGRVLRPGGYAVIDFTNYFSITNLGARIRGVEVETKFWTVGEAKTMLRRAHLESVTQLRNKTLLVQVLPGRIASSEARLRRFSTMENVLLRFPLPGCTFRLTLARKVQHR